MSGLLIRRATEADTETVAALGHATFYYPHIGSTRDEYIYEYMEEAFAHERVRGELRDARNLFHLAEAPAAIGFSKVVFDEAAPLPLPDEFERLRGARLTKLERIYLLESELSRGYGRELFEFNLELARRGGQQGVWLTVWVGNVRAIRFYERAGFKTIGELGFKTGPEENPNYLMIRAL